MNDSLPSSRRTGFTLVEILVVLVIITILVAALVPAISGVRDQARERVARTNTASVSQSLATFASEHDGFYPGVMRDVHANFDDHAAGDNQTANGVMWNSGGGPGGAYVAQTPGPGDSMVWSGVTGGPVNREQFAAARQVNDPSEKTIADMLAWDEAVSNYPANPFRQGSGSSSQIINIFHFMLNPINHIGVNNPVPVLLVSDRNKTGDSVSSCGGNQIFPALGAQLEEYNPIACNSVSIPSLPVSYDDREDNPFEPSSDNNRPGFGPGTVETDSGEVENFFSAGDFAYVPIVTSGPYSQYIGSPFDPDSSTLPDERFKAGTLVSGYYLFGYGAGNESQDEPRFAEEKQAFYQNGIPGMLGPGVDTQYEMAVAALFNGAVFFEKEGVN